MSTKLKESALKSFLFFIRTCDSGCALSGIAPPGFEPGSRDPKSRMLDHYTTGLSAVFFVCRCLRLSFPSAYSFAYFSYSSQELYVFFSNFSSFVANIYL